MDCEIRSKSIWSKDVCCQTRDVEQKLNGCELDLNYKGITLSVETRDGICDYIRDTRLCECRAQWVGARERRIITH